MPTSGAGPSFPLAEEQKTSPPGSLDAFVMPRRKTLRTRGPMEVYMLEMIVGALDDSDVAAYSCSNIEPSPDAGSDVVEEGQQNDEEWGDDPAR